MRISLILLSLFISCVQLCGQVLQIEYNGDPLSEEERGKIEKMFVHEAEFYSQFGLPDTLTIVHLYMFEKKEAAKIFLKSIGVTTWEKVAGLYVTAQNKIVVLGAENGRKRTLAVIYHELSHHFARHIIGVHIPNWFNEGLARYFQNSVITKKGARHSLTDYEFGRIRSMYTLGEINLLEFINGLQDEFMIEEFTNEGYSYTLSHALVTFWIEELPGDMLKRFVYSLKDVDDSSAISERIDKIYSGGFKQFEKDFADFIHNDD